MISLTLLVSLVFLLGGSSAGYTAAPRLAVNKTRIASRLIAVERAEMTRVPDWRLPSNSRKVYTGNPRIRAVALTFDDGPHPLFTRQILEILEKEHVKATFFVVGKMVERYPELLIAEHMAGHEIGNHSFHHPNLSLLPDSEVRAELDDCNRIVKDVAGINMQICRPPGGQFRSDVISTAAELGLTTVFWDINTADFEHPGAAVIKQRVLSQVKNGSIILFHDGIQETIDILPQLIKDLRHEGYKFQTVSEMLRNK